MGLIASTNAEDAGGDEISAYDAGNRSVKTNAEMDDVVDADDIDPYTGRLNYAQRARIVELLGRWEEPARGVSHAVRIVVVSIPSDFA